MAKREMLCPECKRWVTGMSEDTRTLPYHRSLRVAGASCLGSGQKPRETKGFDDPPPTK